MTTRGGLQGRPLFDALHKRCRVWWPLEAQWYSGTVAHWMAAAPSGEPAAVGVVCGGRGWFLLVYDDGEHEWLQLPDSTVVIGSRAALPALPSCPPKLNAEVQDGASEPADSDVSQEESGTARNPASGTAADGVAKRLAPVPLAQEAQNAAAPISAATAPILAPAPKESPRAKKRTVNGQKAGTEEAGVPAADAQGTVTKTASDEAAKGLSQRGARWRGGHRRGAPVLPLVSPPPVHPLVRPPPAHLSPVRPLPARPPPAVHRRGVSRRGSHRWS